MMWWFIAIVSFACWTVGETIARHHTSGKSVAHNGSFAQDTSARTSAVVRKTNLVHFKAVDKDLEVQGSQTLQEHARSTGARVLRLCNAYALREGFDVFHCPPGGRCPGARTGPFVKRETAESIATPPVMHRLTQFDEKLLYKQCVDFEIKDLGAGSVLDFKVGSDASVGSFVVDSALPDSNATLMLVVKRHDRHTTVADFISHVYEDSQQPQIALVDAYSGDHAPTGNSNDTLANEGIDLRTERSDGTTGNWELVHFGSALALTAGMTIDWQLAGKRPTDSSQMILPSMTQLYVQPAKQYVAIRLGVDALDGPARSEELVIFPQSDTALLPSKAVQIVSPVWIVTAMVFTWLM